MPRTAAGKPKETLDSLKGKLLSFNHGVSVMPRLAPRDEAAGRAARARQALRLGPRLTTTTAPRE